MAEALHYRDGNLIDSPDNWQDIEVTFNWLETKEASVKIDDLVFKGEEAIKIQERILNGLNGGVGITEGDPYRIDFGGVVGDPLYQFKGYLDYMDKPQFVGCNEAVVSVKKEQGVDWINEVADAYSFRFMYDQGAIIDSDFTKVPYVINYVPDTVQLILLAISLFIMLKELYEIIKEIANAIAELINSVTPSVGAGVVMDIGDIIWVVLKIIIRIAYAVILVIAIINLIEQIIEQLIPKKRDHLGMKFVTMFERACSFLGLQFESELLYGSHRKDWVCIPSKGHKGEEPPEDEDGNPLPELGCPSQGDNIDKFGQLIRWAKQTWNADYRIEDGIFRLERWDYWEIDSSFVVPNVWTDQKRQLDKISFNTDEIVSNYAIDWAFDTQDQNTLDDQRGRLFQATMDQITTTNPKLKNIKNLIEIDIGMSMATRKRELTDIEEFAKDVAEVIDEVTGAFGNGTNYAQQIDDRVDTLHLSSHFLTLPKVVVMDSSKLKEGQRSLLSATRLYNELHEINSFVPTSSGKHNQWWIPDEIEAGVCEVELKKIIKSNFCTTKDGKKARIDKLVWRPYSNSAKINYRVNELYTNNLKVIKIST